MRCHKEGKGEGSLLGLEPKALRRESAMVDSNESLD